MTNRTRLGRLIATCTCKPDPGSDPGCPVHTMNVPALFQRDGTPANPKRLRVTANGRGRETYITWPCRRCGGAGGAQAWNHTGWTCYDCGGTGKGGNKWVRVYTAGKLAALNEKRDAKIAAKIAARAAKADADRITFLADHPDAVAALNEYGATDDDGKARNDFLASLRWKLNKYGSLTDAQLAAIPTAVQRTIELEERKAKQAAAPHWEAGRQDIEATVLKTDWRESSYGYQTTSTLKMLVKLDDERRAWGTVPDKLISYGDPAFETVKPGDRVHITATVEPSKDDPTFAFYKRPRVRSQAETTEVKS